MNGCTKPPPGWACTRGPDHPGACAAHKSGDDAPVPEVNTWDDMQRWIAIHHRMLVKDAARMTRIEERLDRLERPYWRRR